MPDSPITEDLHPELAELAGAALAASMRRRYDEAGALVTQLERDHGLDGLLAAMLAWCDSLIERLPPRDPDHPVRLHFTYSTDPARTRRTADEVTPAQAWAGQFLAARVAGDHDQALALVRSTATEGTWAAQVGTLLASCGGMIAELAAAAPAEVAELAATSGPTRAEHIRWVQQHALVELDGTARGRINAITSVQSDLGKHPATALHDAILLLTMMAAAGQLDTDDKVRDAIDGLR